MSGKSEGGERWRDGFNKRQQPFLLPDFDEVNEAAKADKKRIFGGKWILELDRQESTGLARLTKYFDEKRDTAELIESCARLKFKKTPFTFARNPQSQTAWDVAYYDSAQHDKEPTSARLVIRKPELIKKVIKKLGSRKNDTSEPDNKLTVHLKINDSMYAFDQGDFDLGERNHGADLPLTQQVANQRAAMLLKQCGVTKDIADHVVPYGSGRQESDKNQLYAQRASSALNEVGRDCRYGSRQAVCL